ncbi:diguanylate cyclase domain-containing protein [Pseudomonas sp. NPDC089569]|uniref:diguanylate cyclase domain-containing protein n=1 Tax=Pseudomonas sp. NPDC089569 TaxID=3390722 RepID=UPI003D02FDB2
MRSYLIKKSKVKFFAFLTVGMLLAAALIFGGLFTIRELDTYIRSMYYGNTAPIGHLASMRAAQFNARRLQWRIFASNDPVKTAEYAKVMQASLGEMSREWQLYYPEGISSPEEKVVAEQIRIDLPQVLAIMRESVRQLEQGHYDEALKWYQARIPFLDQMDQMLSRDIDLNLAQARTFAVLSQAIFNRIFWITVALFALGSTGGVGLSLYWRRQRDNAEQKSREHLWLVDQVFNITMDGVIITDRQGRVTKVNPAFTRMTGYTEDEVMGQNPSLWSSGRQSQEFYAQMWRSLSESGHWQGQLWNRKKSGDLYLESLAITAIVGLDESDLNYAAVCSDITQQHMEQEFQGYLATHDPLTDLPNRLLFRERLTQAIARGHRAGSQVAIMFLDLDHFKEINDNLGHSVGDATLAAIATRLKGCLREVDTVARLGGDEFAIVLEDIHGIEQIEPIARKLLWSVGKPIFVDRHQVSVTPSIGVSIYPDHGDTPETLVKLADQAMYEAKNAGKNAIKLYAKSDLPQSSATDEICATT